MKKRKPGEPKRIKLKNEEDAEMQEILARYEEMQEILARWFHSKKNNKASLL